jgi:hypothetical protein
VGAVCYHGNTHTWTVVLCCFLAFSVFSSKMSAEKRRWVKRKRQMSRVESMLAAKARKSSTVTVQPEAEEHNTSEDASDNTQPTFSASLDDSLLLPRVYSSSDDSDSDCETNFDQAAAKETYKEWISRQPKHDVKMIALILMDTFSERFGMTDVGAASEAGMVVGFNEKSLRTWRNDFYKNGGEFSESHKGKHSRPYVLDDEECKGKAPYRKGVYVDGHERQDVIEYRKMYLRKLAILESTHRPPPLCVDGIVQENIGNPTAQRQLVLLYHDESCFHANEGPSWQWAEEGKLAIRPKSAGRGIMVSDFITEHDGFLALTDGEHEHAKLRYPSIPKFARVLFRYGSQSEGYWNCEKFLIQVETAVQIAEKKYPTQNFTLVFIFDQSSGHTAYPEDALNAHRMNVSDGGKQPKRRDTVWNGRAQSMTTASGQPKGLRTVLEERNVNTAGMNKADMVKVLADMHDFKVQKTRVEELISKHGHKCIFLPKYHCELNPIERVWGQAKRYTRTNCDYSFTGLDKTINPALDSVSVSLIRKYYRRVREYHRAYREGKSGGLDVESAVKLYKSHRRVPETESV